MTSVTALLTDTPIGSKALKFVHNDDDTLTVILTETGRNPVIYATYDVLDTETSKVAQFFADNFPV